MTTYQSYKITLDKEHVAFLSTITDKTFLELQKLPAAQKDEFVDGPLMNLATGEGAQRAMMAEDFITMFNTWDVGQTEETYSIDVDALNAWLDDPYA